MTEDQPLEMPQEVEGMDEAARLQANMTRVIAFGESLAKKRQAAIEYRAQCGIEDEWDAAENAYQSIDAANEGEKVRKPQTLNGSFQQAGRTAQTRSTIFIPITRPYVDAGAARVADMIMPHDDFPFSLKPSPIADGSFGSEAPQGMTPVAAAVVQLRTQYEESAKKAKKRIEDWLVECQWHAELRKFIENMALLGTGIMKGPTPAERTSRVVKQAPTGIAMVIERKISPESRSIYPRNFYPAKGTGESIKEASGVWEKDSITAKQLRELKQLGEKYGYLASQIDQVLLEGPDKSCVNDNAKSVKDDDTYTIWYHHGLADRDDLIAIGETVEQGDVAIPAICVMVNDSVIKAVLNPLDSGSHPYDVAVWQRKAGMMWGSGIAYQIDAPQRMVNGAARNLMDNAGFTAGPQVVIDTDVLEPADNSNDYTLRPRRVWRRKPGTSTPVKDAFIVINIPTMQEQLTGIIQLGMKLAEDATGLPMIMQGQQGKAPDTVGGMTILNNNSSVVLRRIIRNIDDNLIEPHITRYYEWLMTNPGNDDCKGDYQIDAIASTALIERDTANLALQNTLPLSLNPAYGLDPELVAKQFLESQRLDPKRVELSEDKKKAMREQPPPEAPQVTAAKIRSQTELAKTERMAELQEHKIDVDTDRDAAYVQAENERTRIEWEGRNLDRQLDYQLAILKYANERQITLDQAKADLTKVSMQLTVQKQLNGSNAANPAVEPKGRAPDGQAFAK